jgi:hypothetical protein
MSSNELIESSNHRDSITLKLRTYPPGWGAVHRVGYDDQWVRDGWVEGVMTASLAVPDIIVVYITFDWVDRWVG